MKLFKISVKVIALIAITGTSLDSHSAEVRSMSRPFVNDEGGVKVTSVSVTCAEVDQPRVIIKVGKSKKWCAKELATLCNKQKVAMAKKVCDTHFDGLVLESKGNNEPVREEVVKLEPKLDDKPKLETIEQKDKTTELAVTSSKEQARLRYEEEKILINQELLEIKRRQLEIRKLESELRAKLTSYARN